MHNIMFFGIYRVELNGDSTCGVHDIKKVFGLRYVIIYHILTSYFLFGLWNEMGWSITITNLIS